jgi:multidrug efflux pump subunit AcrA (membrane-fusion protein)
MARFAHIVPIALLLLPACRDEPQVRDERRAVAVQRIRADAGIGTTYAGEIRSAFESQIGFEVAGRIVERRVDLGSSVHAGQTLLRLDNSDYARALDSAAAQSGSARTAAAVQQADLARSRELLKQASFPPEFDQQKAAAVQAQAQLRAAGAQSGTASAHWAAPSSRRAARRRRHADSGRGWSGVGAGQAIVTLADPSWPEIAVALPEGSLDRIRSASRLSVSVWSSPGRRTLPGSAASRALPILRRAPLRHACPSMRRHRRCGWAKPPNCGSKMQRRCRRPGAADGRAAIQRRRRLGLDRRTMTVQPRAVQIGAAQGDMLTILSGLRPGETIVTAGIHLLRAGEKVRVVQVPPHESTRRA